MWRDIKSTLHQYHDFVITTHVNPDGDGIGSAAALIELLLMMGKKGRFICASPIPKKFAFLDVHGSHTELLEGEELPDAEVLIVLDTHKLDRVGRLSELVTQGGALPICIDHHTMTDTFTSLAAIDDTASSVGTMIYTLFEECGYELNLQAATGIYTSVICDTGRFSYSSTSRQAHKIADECIEKGVDPDLMYSRLYQHVTLNQFKVFAHSLQRMELHLDNKVIIHPICREDYEQTGTDVEEIENIDLEYILELNKQIEEVECVVLLRELDDNHVRVSMRSKSELDIGSLMQQLGGGGHSKAAGALYDGDIESAKRSILKLLQKEGLTDETERVTKSTIVHS